MCRSGSWVEDLLGNLEAILSEKKHDYGYICDTRSSRPFRCLIIWHKHKVYNNTERFCKEVLKEHGWCHMIAYVLYKESSKRINRYEPTSIYSSPVSHVMLKHMLE